MKRVRPARSSREQMDREIVSARGQAGGDKCGGGELGGDGGVGGEGGCRGCGGGGVGGEGGRGGSGGGGGGGGTVLGQASCRTYQSPVLDEEFHGPKQTGQPVK
jgi:hypothetical protein